MDTEENHYLNVFLSSDGAADVAEINKVISKQLAGIDQQVDSIVGKLNSMRGVGGPGYAKPGYGGLAANIGLQALSRTRGVRGFAGSLGRVGANFGRAGARGNYANARDYAGYLNRNKSTTGDSYWAKTYAGTSFKPDIKPKFDRSREYQYPNIRQPNMKPEFDNNEEYQEAPVQYPGLVRPDAIPEIQRVSRRMGNPSPVGYQESVNKSSKSMDDDSAALRALQDRLGMSRKRGGK